MNKRKKKSAAVSGNQPSDRVAELERKITKLQKDVAMLKRLSGWPYWGDEGNELEANFLSKQDQPGFVCFILTFD